MTNTAGQPFALPAPPDLTAKEIDQVLWASVGKPGRKKLMRYWYARLMRIKNAQA